MWYKKGKTVLESYTDKKRKNRKTGGVESKMQVKEQKEKGG